MHAPSFTTTKPPTAAWNNSAVTWLLGSEIDLYLWAVNVWILLHTVTLAYSWLFLFSCPGCSTDEECPEPKHSAHCECEVTHFKCWICVSYQQHTVLFFFVFCFFWKKKKHNKPLSESDFIMNYGLRGLSFRVQTSWAHGVYSDALYFYNRGDKVMVSKTHFYSK